MPDEKSHSSVVFVVAVGRSGVDDVSAPGVSGLVLEVDALGTFFPTVAVDDCMLSDDVSDMVLEKCSVARRCVSLCVVVCCSLKALTI